MARMNSSSQISVRAFSAAPKNTASDASSLIEVHLSSSPDPRWRACFNFVLQGREIAYLQDKPVFDHASFKATLLPGYADSFRQELPELIAAASALARAQTNKDASR
ncbi:hypothetical protein FFY45_15015 [Xanthomonas hortorum]|uniref:Uncharacterized protein n=1 Tax=Xanthomonas hortorum pv. pelargonii TaxID=453602 RepID=A0AAW9ZR13_9XANT|nr:hypothetical protein [Xanthomonas hortorum]NMI21277.1 hypothetical protein [Xanthomonas hortorum pv. pelargonii]NMI53749.1 hypothetical protein [Xanthomonas hortorum pv. taraxaci]